MTAWLGAWVPVVATWEGGLGGQSETDYCARSLRSDLVRLHGLTLPSTYGRYGWQGQSGFWKAHPFSAGILQLECFGRRQRQCKGYICRNRRFFASPMQPPSRMCPPRFGLQRSSMEPRARFSSEFPALSWLVRLPLQLQDSGRRETK